MPFSSIGQTLSEFSSSITADNVSEPTTYGDSIVFGVAGSGVHAWCGGADFSETSANYTASGLSITTTLGNNTIDIGATPASNVKIGGYIHLTNGTEEYTGRVVNVASPNVIVDPAPIRTTTSPYTSIAYYPVLPQVGTNNDGEYVSYAGCVGTFVSGGDSRIVLGNVKITNASTGSTSQHPNRIMWSVREASDATVSNCDGLVQATRAGFPNLNYIDIEDIEQVIALVPIGSGNMLVVGTKQCVMLAGQLLTQSAGRRMRRLVEVV